MAEMKAAEKQGDDDCKSDQEAGTNETGARQQRKKGGRKRKMKDHYSSKGTKTKGGKKRKAETLDSTKVPTCIECKYLCSITVTCKGWTERPEISPALA